MPENLMDKLVSLAKRRGFVFQSSEIYGGLGSVWDYGPLGVELKKNIKERWWRSMVHDREDIEGLDAAILMHPKVWEASGHVSGFTDPLVDCKHCKNRFRADDPRIKGTPGEPTAQCPVCGSKGTLTAPRMFNLMFKTFMGPVEEAAALVYLRPETAQGIYVNYLNVLQSSRQKIPFGIAQIGKAFRNEITPGNFIFRTRELEYLDVATNERFIPYVVETSAGADRTTLVVMADAYHEEEVEGEKRVVLRLHPAIAPLKAAVFPLVNKDGMPELARRIFDDLRKHYNTFYDDGGSIGRRYRRQDEAGTPFGITIDGQSTQDGTVTVRDRDTLKQERVAADRLATYLAQKLKG